MDVGQDVLLPLPLDKRIERCYNTFCSSCKKIRDDEGYWNQLETYFQERSEAVSSQGLCPECAKKLYPEISEDNE
jgi:hypothetical protein